MIGANRNFFIVSDDHMLWDFIMQSIRKRFTGRTGHLRPKPSTALCSRIPHSILFPMSVSLMSAAAIRPALRKQVLAVSFFFCNSTWSANGRFCHTYFLPCLFPQPVASLARSLNTSATSNMASTTPNPPDNTPAQKEPMYKTFEIYRWVCTRNRSFPPFEVIHLSYLNMLFIFIFAEPRYTRRKAYPPGIQGRLERLRPNGAGRSH